MQSTHLSFADSRFEERISQYIVDFLNRNESCVLVQTHLQDNTPSLSPQPMPETELYAFSQLFRIISRSIALWEWSPPSIMCYHPLPGKRHFGEWEFSSTTTERFITGEFQFCLNNWYFPYNAHICCWKRFRAILLRYFLAFWKCKEVKYRLK